MEKNQRNPYFKNWTNYFYPNNAFSQYLFVSSSCGCRAAFATLNL